MDEVRTPLGEGGAEVIETDRGVKGAREVMAPGWAPTLDGGGRVKSFEAYEAEIFRFALMHAGGCVSRAAEMLRVGRATMYRKMRAYAIAPPPVSERMAERSRKPRLGRAAS